MELEFPDMRAEVVELLRSLADRKYQQRVWVDKIYPHDNFYDDFTMTVNILDDIRVLDQPEVQIGGVLASEAEAQLMRAVSASLNRLFDEYGTDRTDEFYIHAPEWRVVVDSAGAALEELLRNDATGKR